MSTTPPDGPEPDLRFETRPYEPDGGCPPLGFLLILVLGVPCAVVTGVFTAWLFGVSFDFVQQIPEWHLFLLALVGGFLLLHAPLIFVVWVAVRWGKVRSARAVEVASGVVVAAAVLPAVLFELRTRYGPGLPGPSEDEYFSYATYGVSCIIIAAIMIGVARKAASHPFCTECDTWKKVRFKRKVNLPPHILLSAVRSGDLVRLAEYDTSREGPLTVTVTACPYCGLDAPAEVKIEQMTIDARGRHKLDELAHVSYPGPATVVLEAIFSPDASSGPGPATAG